MDRTIRVLEDTIMKLINVTDLPIEVKRLIVADVYHTVIKEADSQFINMIEEEKDNAEST